MVGYIPRKDFIKMLQVEWKTHKENCDEENHEWYECSNSETHAYVYAVGAKITDENGKTTILDTPKKAEAYTKKEWVKYGGCYVCQRFKRMIAATKSGMK